MSDHRGSAGVYVLCFAKVYSCSNSQTRRFDAWGADQSGWAASPCSPSRGLPSLFPHVNVEPMESQTPSITVIDARSQYGRHASELAHRPAHQKRAWPFPTTRIADRAGQSGHIIFCGSGACRTSLFFYKPCMTIRYCQTRTMVLTRRVRRGGVVGARPALEVQNGLRLDRTDRTKATNPAWH